MATSVTTADCSNLRINATTPANPTTVQDTNSGSKYVMQYTTGATRDAHGLFVIPPNYLTGNVTMRARLRCPVATSGTLQLALATSKFSTGGAVGTGGASSVTATVGTPTGSAGGIFEAVFDLTSSLPTVGVVNLYAFRIRRVTASDTVSGTVELLDYDIEYTFDPGITKQYTWLPANIWLALAGSPSSLGAGLTAFTASSYDPYAHVFPDSAGNKVGVHTQLPSTFIGGLTSYTIWANGASGTSAYSLGLAMGSAAVGAAYDATLTTDTFSVSPAGSTTVIFTSRAAPISPNAGEMLSLQFSRDNSDAAATSMAFYGVLLEYNVFTASPSPLIDVSPECWSAPTSGAASLLGIADTNNSGYVQRFTQGLDQACQTKRIMPSIYVSGGTFRGYLRTSAASGTIKMRIDYGNPANGANADPVLATGSVVNVPVTGANQLHMFTADISAGLLASDEVILSMVRVGSSDGVTADVDFVEGHVEVGVGA